MNTKYLQAFQDHLAANQKWYQLSWQFQKKN